MIYIHIPYCKSFCTYCGFHSEIHGTGMAGFVDALRAEIRSRSGEIAASAGLPVPEGTLYVGGGTPSLLSPEELYSIVAEISDIQERSRPAPAGKARESGNGLRRFREFTIEVNPDDIAAKGVQYVKMLKEIGVNRVSMGVQSMNDGVLEWMNRRHRTETSREAYRILMAGGLENVGIDLIFGMGAAPRADGRPSPDPEQERASGREWEETVREALAISGDGRPPKHVSAYQLSADGGSALSEMLASGKYVEASDESCARQYGFLCRTMRAAGYRHYEISNFAQPGYEALHNSAYWNHVPYVGLGPAAHSLTVCGGKFIRSWNAADNAAYIHAAGTGDFAGIRESETLTDEQAATEKIMLPLRTDAGVSRDFLENSPERRRRTEKLIAAGMLEETGGNRLRIPEKHFFVSDSIIAELV